MNFKVICTSMAALGLVFSVSCDNEKEESRTNTSAKSESTTVKSLSLSSVVNIKIPNSVSGKSSSLHLNSTNKSYEACQLRREVKQGLTQIADIGATICHIEGIPNIELGKKYEIKLSLDSSVNAPQGEPQAQPPASALKLNPGGEIPTLQLFIDNSSFATDKLLTFYMCEDKKLTNMIRVKKDGDTTNGKFVLKGDFSSGEFSNTFHAAASFYKKGNNTAIEIKDKMSSVFSGETSKSGRVLYLNLDDSENGISTVASSTSGTYGGLTLDFASVAKFGGDHGVVYQKWDQFSTKAYFDSNQNVISSDPLPSVFAANGTHFIAESSMPKKLGDDFTPDDFPAGAWDCQTEEALEFTLTPEVMNACQESGFDMPDQSCSLGDGFEMGDTAIFDEADFDEGYEDSIPGATEFPEPDK